MPPHHPEEHAKTGSIPASWILEADHLASTMLHASLADNQHKPDIARLGSHPRRQASHEGSFLDYRAYRPEDPSSRIDWRRSARSDTLYVRDCEPYHAWPIRLWRDNSGSMNYGGNYAGNYTRNYASRIHKATQAPTQVPTTKTHRASVILLAMAIILAKKGEQIGLDGFSPHGHMSIATALARDLQLAAQQAPYPFPPLMSPIPKGTTLIWLGDFLDPLPALEKALRARSAFGAYGYLLRILTPDEISFPFTGRTLFQGCEGEQHYEVHNADTLQKSYIQRHHEHEYHLAHLAHRLGWTLIQHRTDHKAIRALQALFHITQGPLPHRRSL